MTKNRVALLLQLLLQLLLAASAWAAGPAPARAPEAVVAIEREVWDDPDTMLRLARGELAALAPGAHAQRLRALVREVVAATAVERIEEATARLPQAQALARELQAHDMQCLLQAAALTVEHESRGWAAMAESAGQVLRAARTGGPAWCVPRLLMALTHAHANDGRRAAALEAGREAEAAFEAAGEALMLAVVRNHLGWALSERDDDPQAVQQAIDLGERALAGFDPLRQRVLVSVTQHNLAGARMAAKDWAGARRNAAAAEAVMRELGDATGLAYLQRQQGEIELRDGHPAVALAHLGAARRHFTEAGIDAMVVVAAALEAEALVALRRPAEALRVLAEARPARTRLGPTKMDVPYFRTAMDAHAAVHDAPATAAAARAYGDALQHRQREENHRLATELQERHASAQREAENRMLKGQQEVQRLRMLVLGALLVLAALALAALGVYLVHQRRLRMRLKRLAEVDELTGLPNRRAILEILNDAGARARGGRAIAMLDIDHFKRVNDRFGHAAGDAALVTFASTCTRVLRPGDVMGRLGGEEFLLVLERARAADLQPLFERMRAALQASPVEGMPPEERLSFSMGAVDLPQQADVDAALRAADEALYRAKARGRDRMEVAPADCRPDAPAAPITDARPAPRVRAGSAPATARRPAHRA